MPAVFRFFYVPLLILLFSLPGLGQEIEFQANLQADRLQPQDQNILAEIPRRLEDYVNSYQWADEYDEMRLKVRMNIVVTTVRTRGSEKIFRAQFLVQSSAGGNFLDQACEFPYIEGQSMDHQRPIFNSLLSIVDYYIYMLLGVELDTYLLKGGTRYYDQARNIADEGLISQYATGWKSRLEDQQLITDADHSFLRDALFYFYEGLFYIEEKQDDKKAVDYSGKVVELLKQMSSRRPNSKILKRFLDAHHKEFCVLFTYDQGVNNYREMMRIDNRHSEVYAECMSKGKSRTF